MSDSLTSSFNPLAALFGRLACRAVCAAPDEPKRTKQANLTPLLRINKPNEYYQ